MTGAAIFKTSRLVARDMNPDDWRELVAFACLPEVARMMASVKTDWSETEARAWMARAPFRGQPGFCLGLHDTAGVLVGFLGIAPLPDMGVPSVMYAIAPEYQGRGYATEALRALLVLAFGPLDVSSVGADHFHDNLASGRVLSKLGFKYIRDDTAKSAARVEPERILLYRLTKSQFEAAHEIS
ncbi:GNAT family N-acetyltransferase [Candidatus Halocynthiibacter alkanivorans]|jgi:RimJ/RimL family protein N-acetyltransferase|uniref:GNAT family N-acetyltransferase n=1 Tax=Candidatus Halocynthiibacter alkanivorans TaxID=2267619 RepID=UPI000DF131D9|nr:GNAT family N-acetyltransferase [Candidatus Halocynthiibacter alkanivorans]